MPYKVNDRGGQRPVIDDEQLERMMGASTPGFFARNRFRLVTLALIAINVIVFAAEAAVSVLAGAHVGVRVDVPPLVLVGMGAMYAPLVQAGELFRFVTPMFLHMDLMHLGFNMVALYSVGEGAGARARARATSWRSTSWEASRATPCRMRPTCWRAGCPL